MEQLITNLAASRACRWLLAALAMAIAGATTPAVAAGDVRVWTADPLAPVGGEKFPVPADVVLKPMRLVGPINGVCSAQIVVSSASALPKVVATMGPLATKQGDKLPASALTVRYAVLKTSLMKAAAPYCDVLLDAPAGDASIQPVWLTATIPAGTKPGSYTGNLAVSVGGKATPVPVELTVCDWKMPNPKDGQALIGLFPSFEATANRYGVPLWSDAHWKLLSQSLELLGRTGNDIVHIPLVAGTFVSAKQSILVFRKTGDGFVPDFTIFDKYLALYDKQVGVPKILVLDVWDQMMDNERTTKGGKPSLNYIVSNAGKYEPAAGPYYGDPGSEKIWKAAFDGVKASLKKVGWDKTIVVLGEANDTRPSPELGKFFDQLWPGICWNVHTHGRGDPPMKPGQIREIAGIRYLLYEHPDGKAGRNPAAVPIQGRQVIDGKVTLIASSTRHNWVQHDALPHMYRALPDVAMGSNSLCATRYGLDYWGGEMMFSGWFNLWRNNAMSVIAPGPTGPVSTVRFEMLVEGVQELEARLAIEEALVAKTISGDLAKQASDFMVERRKVRRSGKGNDWVAGPDWQDRTQRLFDLAGEVVRATPKQ